MSKPPRRAKPPNWSRKLARVIMLDDGRIGSCTYVAHRNGPRAIARRSLLRVVSTKPAAVQKALDSKALYCLLRQMKVPVTVHGFRSSFRDWCGNETEFAREHVEEALGHLIGNAVERAYRRQAALEKRRVILQ